ncbi:hypothetical protein Ccrd_014988 [Cynara cardunculus var. scolymus]|uniref:Uncharacterized protein n=1 Tax=Cynara cardunculus var. scolymus TaxID=59895 RepID=A0A103YCP6_CYNCS|nr:hypothetical protein Ccrd_014988 [Cynara cardunculus var. scolymus]
MISPYSSILRTHYTNAASVHFLQGMAEASDLLGGGFARRKIWRGKTLRLHFAATDESLPPPYSSAFVNF